MLTQEKTATASSPVAVKSDATTIARGAGINVLGTCAKAVKSGSFVVLARLFGAEVFGLYMLSWSVIDLAAKIGNFGLDRAVLRFLPLHRYDGSTKAAYETISRAFVISFLVSVVIAISLFFTAPLLSQHVFNKPDMAGMLALMALCLPGLAVLNIGLSVPKAHKIMKYDAYVRGISDPIVMFLVACTAFFLGWKLVGIAVGQVATLTVSAVLAVFIFTKFYSWRQCLAELKSLTFWTPLTRFSIPVMGYEFVYILMIRLDTLMIGYFLPALQVGIYAVAVEIALTTKKVRQWFDPIFSPIIAELHHLKEMDRLAHNFALVARWILTINLSFLACVLLIGKDLLTLFGPEFGIGFVVVIILAFSQVVYASIGSGDTMLIMSGHPYINLVNTLIALVLNFLLNLWLIPLYDMLGAAIGTLVAFTFLTVIRVVELYHLFRIHPFRRMLWKPLTAATMALFGTGAIATMLPDSSILRLLALPLLFLSTYGVLLLQFGLEPDDVTIVNRIKARIKRSKPTVSTPMSLTG